jgi:sugar phosphate isomerase/epimerase
LSFTLSVVTDEIAQDPAVAIAAARDMGFSHLEFNRVRERSMHELSDSDVAELGRMAAGAGMQVIAVDPPSFKTVLLDDVPVAEVARHAEVAEHLEQIRRSCQAARTLGAGLVRLFSFRRSSMVGMGNPSPREPQGGPIPDDLLPKIVAGLRAAAAIADEYDVTLGLENVRSCWGNTGHNAARILAAVDHPRLRAIWDPGNDYVSGGVPYPDGYRAVLPYIVHVHVKDAAVVDAATGLTRWACIGTGAVDYAGQIAALRRDGYRGAISVETHWRKPGDGGLESTRDTLAGLRRFL